MPRKAHISPEATPGIQEATSPSTALYGSAGGGPKRPLPQGRALRSQKTLRAIDLAENKRDKISRWAPTRDDWEVPEYRSFLGWREIFRLHGSVYASTLPRLLVGITILITLKVLHGQDITYFDSVFEHQFAYQVYTYVVGFLLVFRVNLAYNRWWEGRTWLEQMSSKFFDMCSQAVAFDCFSETPEEDKVLFRLRICGLTSLLHQQCITELSHSKEIPYLAEYLDAESYHNHMFGKDSIIKDGISQTMVFIQVLLSERFQAHPVEAPIISRMYQEMSNGMLGYHQAVKIKCTPFPFPFIQVITLSMTLLALTLPLVIHKYVESLPWALLFLTSALFGYCALAEVAGELEQPFGDDDNDLPLLGFQLEFDAELRSLAEEMVYAPPRASAAMLGRVRRPSYAAVADGRRRSLAKAAG